MEAAFTGAEDVVNRGAVFGRALNGLVKGVVFLGRTGAPGQVTIVVGASQKAHAGVLDVSIIDCEPAGNSFARSERPIAGILMPSNAFAVAGHFAKKNGIPSRQPPAQANP